jgi:hypothetical protein
MPHNLKFTDPETGHEYDAEQITGETVKNLPPGRYKVVCEITQFGMWGSKSYVIIRDDGTWASYWYMLETFDDVRTSKRQRRAKAQQ